MWLSTSYLLSLPRKNSGEAEFKLLYASEFRHSCVTSSQSNGATAFGADTAHDRDLLGSSDAQIARPDYLHLDDKTPASSEVSGNSAGIFGQGVLRSAGRKEQIPLLPEP